MKTTEEKIDLKGLPIEILKFYRGTTLICSMYTIKDPKKQKEYFTYSGDGDVNAWVVVSRRTSTKITSGEGTLLYGKYLTSGEFIMENGDVFSKKSCKLVG